MLNKVDHPPRNICGTEVMPLTVCSLGKRSYLLCPSTRVYKNRMYRIGTNEHHCTKSSESRPIIALPWRGSEPRELPCWAKFDGEYRTWVCILRSHLSAHRPRVRYVGSLNPRFCSRILQSRLRSLLRTEICDSCPMRKCLTCALRRSNNQSDVEAVDWKNSTPNCQRNYYELMLRGRKANR